MSAGEDDMMQRIRFLESEMEGEKVVTRHILTKVQEATGDIAALRVEVGRVADDMVLVKGAQIVQGQALNILTQEVRGLRAETTALRTRCRRGTRAA
jgi:hypothetical protein